MKLNEQYKEQRKEFESRFERYSKIAGSEQEFVSPSGLYKLEISKYGNGQEVCWNYSRGIVTEVESGKILADVKRNIGHFWHAWVEHPNGNEYLLCGEDYQGYSVVNLTQGTYQVYFPDEGYQGVGFCWTVVFPSPDKLMLAVEAAFGLLLMKLCFMIFGNLIIYLTKNLGALVI